METTKTYVVLFLELLVYDILSGAGMLAPLLLDDLLGMMIVVLLILLLFFIKILLLVIFVISVLKSSRGFHYNAFIDIKKNVLFFVFLLAIDSIILLFLPEVFFFISLSIIYLPIIIFAICYRRKNSIGTKII